MRFCFTEITQHPPHLQVGPGHLLTGLPLPILHSTHMHVSATKPSWGIPTPPNSLPHLTPVAVPRSIFSLIQLTTTEPHTDSPRICAPATKQIHLKSTPGHESLSLAAPFTFLGGPLRISMVKALLILASFSPLTSRPNHAWSHSLGDPVSQALPTCVHLSDVCPFLKTHPQHPSSVGPSASLRPAAGSGPLGS